MSAAYDESHPEVKHYARRYKQYEATQKIRGARKQLLDLCKHATTFIGEINKRESTDLRPLATDWAIRVGYLFFCAHNQINSLFSCATDWAVGPKGRKILAHTEKNSCQG
jgi:hypothetical protein